MSEVSFETKKLLEPNYISSEARSISSSEEFYSRLFENQHIVFLSSVSFANTVLQGFFQGIQAEQENLNYMLLFGDFWGDPRAAEDLYNNIEELSNLAFSLFALRTSVNGTDAFNEHFTDIEFNSTTAKRNRFLRRYWSQASRCDPAETNCQLLDRLPTIDRPILRNYKAPLVMDAVYGLAKYVVEYRNQTGQFPDDFSGNFYGLGQFPDDSSGNYGLLDGGVLEVFNNFTGNRWKFGIPGSNTDPNWIQPLEWSYDILSGLEFEELYGSWDINATGLATKSGVLTVFKASFPPNFTRCDYSEIDCDASSLYSMTALVVIILVLLFVVVIIYICSGTKGVTVVRQFVRSPGKLILGLDLFVSFCVSFWVIFGDEALDCESRTDDFLVTLTNSLCYTILIGYLLTFHIDNNVAQFCMQVCGCGVLVAIQISISAVAHFDVDSAGDVDPVQHCYAERNKAIVAVSYWYSGMLLLGCVLLLLYSLVSASGRLQKLGMALKIVIGFVALAVGAIYVVALSVIIWVDNQEFCLSHGRFFIVLAVYPGIVCLLASAIPLVTQMWKQRKIESLQHVKKCEYHV